MTVTGFQCSSSCSPDQDWIEVIKDNDKFVPVHASKDLDERIEGVDGESGDAKGRYAFVRIY